MHEPETFLGKYVFSFDHKVIGIQYLVTAFFMALVGAGLSVLIRAQLAEPSAQLFAEETYPALFTMHGTIMVFFVVSLAISGFGNFLIPFQVGARDMAYPFLNMLSYWTVVPACLVMLGSFFVEGGAAAAGWTAYPPLSAEPSAIPGSGLGQTLWLLAMALFIASFTMGGLNFVATILNMRTEGLSMMRLPIAIWGFLVAAVLGLLAFPALTAAAIMLLLDRHGGTSFFVPEMFLNDQVLHAGAKGTPLLFQHLFWFLGHPEVYVLVIPCLLMAFEIVPVFTRRPVFGYRTSIWALMGIAFLSMIVWGHHMFTTGMNPYIGEYFSVVTVVITAPFAVVAVNLLASLWGGKLRLKTPMLFCLAVISAVGFGGFGGLFLGTMISDIYLHDTYFVVGHFHLMIGTVTLLSLFGAVYFWFPKMFGRMMDETLGKIHFWLTFVPMMTIFVLMHMQGLGGMLRRYYSVYAFTSTTVMLHWPISLMAFLAFGGQFVFLFNVIKSIRKGEVAGENPWEAATLEWSTPSPAPHGNFGAELPVVHRWAYEYSPPEAAPESPDYIPQWRQP